MINLKEIMRNQRILLVQDDCPECGIWKLFIWRINLQIKTEKRIKIIDCTLWSYRGVYTHPLQDLFDKYIERFPVLFFDGMRIDDANTVTEAEAFIRAVFKDDFIVKQENKYLFNKECRYVRKGLFRRKTLVCE